jgi:hypothetical protein
MRNSNTTIVILLVLILSGLFLNRLHKGRVTVDKHYLDSIIWKASIPPDTIIDTLWLKEEPVIVEKPIPIPVYLIDSTKTYIDSIVNKEIDAEVKLTVKGNLLGISWKYRPKITTVTKEIRIPEPYPVKYEVPISTPQKGTFLMLGIGKGFDNHKPAISAEVFYQTKKALILGLELGHFQTTYFQVKFGKKF